eukprot:scaffold39082_cov18-Tisochrysis_lutea.AAC.1
MPLGPTLGVWKPAPQKDNDYIIGPSKPINPLPFYALYLTKRCSVRSSTTHNRASSFLNRPAGLATLRPNF